MYGNFALDHHHRHRTLASTIFSRLKSHSLRNAVNNCKQTPFREHFNGKSLLNRPIVLEGLY